MKAHEFLYKAASLLEERGKEYDKPEGERSMSRTVTAFNAITGRDLSESDGWLLLQVLKDVRQWQNPGRYHQDSAEDCISYAALKAEALASASFGELTAEFVEPASLIDDESPRAQILGQNGEMASEIYAAIDGRPSWDEAPSWCNWAAAGSLWCWFELEPEWKNGLWHHGGGKWENTNANLPVGMSSVLTKVERPC